MFQITYKKTNSVTVTLSFNVLQMARWQSHRSRHNAITDNSLWICFILSFSWTMNLRAILCYNVSSLETAWHSKSKSNIRLMALSWTQVNTKSWNQALQIIDHTAVLALLILSIKWYCQRHRHNAITNNSPWICFILSLSWTMNLRARLCYNVSSLDTAWHSKSKSNIRLMALSWTQVNTKSWNQALQTIDHTVVLALLTLSIKAVLKNKTISSYSSSMHKAFFVNQDAQKDSLSQRLSE